MIWLIKSINQAFQFANSKICLTKLKPSIDSIIRNLINKIKENYDINQASLKISLLRTYGNCRYCSQKQKSDIHHHYLK